MGFEKEIIRAGTGVKPNRGQTVTVHCTGYGKNRNLNEKFWSTKDPGQEPFKFKLGLGQVIKGWDEGVMSMSVGEIARLKCSPDYAYGAGGFPAWGSCPTLCLFLKSRFSVQLRAAFVKGSEVMVRIACGDSRNICDQS